MRENEEMGRFRAYVDGFNLYYGLLKGTSERWLDLPALCRRLLSGHELETVVYCTANVVPKPDAPGAELRQQVYLRVLQDDPQVEVVLGRFSVKNTWMARRHNPQCSCCSKGDCLCCTAPTAPVIKYEEKGSDVHLGVRMVADAFQDCFDLALLITGDSDLQPAVDIVRKQTGTSVIVCDPRNRPHRPVTADEYRPIRRSALKACQYDSPYRLADGTVLVRPESWT